MDSKLQRIKLHDGFKIYNNFITIFLRNFTLLDHLQKFLDSVTKYKKDLIEKHLLGLLEK